MPPGGAAMKARMPIISSGAVSPSARAMPMIVPVRMPGKRQRKHVLEGHLHLRRADAERGIADRRRHRLDRVAPGDDDHRHGHQRQRQPADQRRRARQVHDVEEHREAEQAEDDRGHRGEVVDADLDRVGPAVARREFLEIDGGEHADREGEQHGDDDGQEAALERAPHADRRRVGRIRRGEELRVEAAAQRVAPLELGDEPVRLGVAAALGGDVERRCQAAATRSRVRVSMAGIGEDRVGQRRRPRRRRTSPPRSARKPAIAALRRARLRGRPRQPPGARRGRSSVAGSRNRSLRAKSIGSARFISG